MNIRSAVIFLASTLSSVSFACEMTDLKFLVADDAMHYEFTQSKTVAALSQPLISSGVMGLSKAQQLVWQTLRPLKSTLVISAEGLKQFNRNDELVNDMENPIATELAQVFLSLLSGDTKALDATFTQKLTCENENWHLSLEPIEDELKNILTTIALDGAARIEKISFAETRGDNTEIVLSPALEGPVENFATYVGN